VKKIKQYWFQAGIFFLLLIGGILRFWDYQNRWGFAFDQAHDVLVAREGIRQGKIPLLGPFASGANVVGGPQWYWAIMIFSLINPKWILTPWVCLTFLYIFFIYLMVLIGKELGGKKLGLIVGLIVTFSPLQISQGVNLTNQSPMALVSAMAILTAIKYLKTKKLIYAFLLGNFVSLGISIHLQGIGLLFVLIAVMILGWPHSFLGIILIVLGLVFQFLPWIIFDLNNNFYNLRNLWQYYRWEQYKIWIPNRWLTYAFSFWPDLWRKIVGGNYWLSLFQGISLLLFGLYHFFHKKLRKEFLLVSLSFILIFISLRYYRGERFESYYVFTHPFVFLLSGWLVLNIFNWKKLAGGIFLLSLIIGSLFQIKIHYQKSTNTLYPLVKEWEEVLKEKFPGEKFAVYDYEMSTKTQTTALSLVLDIDRLIDDGGVKIGISREEFQIPSKTFYNKDGYSLTNISDIKKEGDKWAFLNPSEIWKGTEEWWKK
jgi:hypothetical protein